MLRRSLLVVIVILLFPALAPARDKNENWLSVNSPHFVVMTNSSEKQGRRIADQFERMRSVFHVAFPKLEIDPGAPIVVLAVKDEKDFRALEPEAYLARGSLKLAGLFLRAPDKNYVLMRVDAEGPHPYSTIYHEYTHLLMNKSADWMPLWMNEGLAEFYQNTDIHEKDASIGEPSSENIVWLRENRLLPLTVLFAVDQKSPYYHEENKGSIFYAESWALVHYIEMTDFKQKTNRLGEYSVLLAQNADPVTAATKAFGDLKRLQSDLEGYVRGGSFGYFKLTTTTEVDDAAFRAQPLTAAQSDAIRGDFMAYDQRFADAQALLDHVLKEDPNNVSAHETKGFLEFRQGHLEQAREWYAQAVQLDSQSYLAHYYYAAMAITGGNNDSEQVENSLRTAIKLNPKFGPAYDRLAVSLGMRHKNLDEARMMGLAAITLEPSNVGYRINMANLLLTMDRGKDAVQVLRSAAKVAKTPEESQQLDDFLMHALEFEESQERYAEQRGRIADEGKSGATASVSATTAVKIPQLSRRPEFMARGPHKFLAGVLKSVHCDNPALDLTVTSNGKQLALHVDNYYKLQFSTLGFQPRGDLNPCADLENRPAKVEYIESANPSVAAQLISVELHK